MNADEVKGMVESSKMNNVTLLEGMWTRYLPHIDIIRRLVDESSIGDIHTLFACHGQDFDPFQKPQALDKKEAGGGALLDLGIYVVSLAHMVWVNQKI